jgi:hypothetical protein
MSLPSTVNIQRVRGDTYPIIFTVNDANGDPVDITNYTFMLTVDPSEAPEDDTNNLFEIQGSIVSGPDGTVSFTPTAGDANQTPGGYYYDVEMVDTGSAVRTIAKGAWEVVQDITK